MPRQPRQYSSTGIYHIMIRGNEQRNIFHDKTDKEKFLYILQQKKEEGEFHLYAYCLMDNHVHLIIKEEKDPITRIMKRINTSYASYYNKKHNRIGHVFQDRYRSEAIEEESYFLEVIRYVHNNPVKAKLVDLPHQYPWSSYHLYIDMRNNSLGLVKCHEVLELYSRNKQRAVEHLIEYTNRQGSVDAVDIENHEAKEEKIKLDIDRFLKERGVELQHLKKDKILRNELIQMLKKKSDNSIRKIAEALGVNRNIVQRIGTDEKRVKKNRP